MWTDRFLFEQVTGFSPLDSDKNCPQEVLQDAQLVIIPAGMARKPGMTRDDLFDVSKVFPQDIHWYQV